MAKLSVLFVSATNRAKRPFFDPSTRYRCYNLAQELSRRGHRALVMSQSMFETQVYELASFDIYVFHRPALTDLFIEAFHLIPRHATKIIDFDDLIFDVRHADQTPMVRSRGGSARDARAYLGRVGEAMSLFSDGTFSTQPLAAQANELLPSLKTFVLPNTLDPGFVGLARLARAASPYRTRPFRFGYFSGTSSHDRDLAMIAPALAEALRSDKHARLMLAGPVEVPADLEEFANQIAIRPLVSFHALPRLMSEVQMVLAPLEDTVFTRSKSGLKFFEAAVIGARVAASPIPDIDRFESPLLTKCRSLDDWRGALHARPPAQEAIDREAAAAAATNSVQSSADAWLTNYVGNP